MDYNDYIDNSDDDYSYNVENDEHDDNYVDNKKSDLFLCVPNKKKIFFFKRGLYPWNKFMQQYNRLTNSLQNQKTLRDLTYPESKN